MQCPGKITEITYAGGVAGQGFNTKPTVQTCELKAALPHIPHGIGRHTQHKINTKPATIRALASSNTTGIPKQLDGVLNGADGMRVCAVIALSLQRKAQKKNIVHQDLLRSKTSPAVRRRGTASWLALAFVLPLQISQCSFLTLRDNKKA